MTAPTLLLIHGFPLDSSVFRPFLPYLEPYFRVLTPDLPGFGKSSAAPLASLEEIAEALAALLTREAPAGAFVAGHSMGGYLALTLARRAPQRVLGLGLLSTQSAADAPERAAGRRESAEKVLAQGISSLAGTMPAKLSADPGHINALREVIARQKAASAAAALQAMAARPDLTPALTDFPGPIVLLHGLVDVLIPPQRAREMLAAQPSAVLRELPGVGHMPVWEAPAESAAALLELL
ncbi:MAG: alpha/beta fold hydrolase [Anaerolineales bacterium]